MDFTLITTHYNMSKTLEESLRSMIDFVPDGTEMVVVDAGSDDGSLEILKEYEEEDEIRLIVEEGCNRGEGRQIGLKAATNPHIIQGLDFDDLYTQSNRSFVQAYKKIYENGKYFLKGDGLNIFQKEKALELGGFRPVHIFEDKSLWLRFIEDDSLVYYDLSKQYGNEIKDYNNDSIGGILRTKYIIGRESARLGSIKNAFHNQKKILFPVFMLGFIRAQSMEKFDDFLSDCYKDRWEIDWEEYYYSEQFD